MKTLNIYSIISLFCFLLPQTIYSQFGVTSADSLAIAQQLSAFYNTDYIVYQIINVDSAENYIKEFGRINDPYSTLNDCLIFTANKNQIGFGENNSIVGVYKNETVIWKSDFIIPKHLEFGSIFGAIDLNNDGGIDIISEWTNQMDNYGSKYLWIHSWDGNSGEVINDVGDESYIFTHGYKLFDIADFEGDGIWEIVGYLAAQDMSDIPEVYSWDGEKYTYSEMIQIDSIYMFFPRNEFTAEVRASVSKINESNFNYSYLIKNESISTQYINEINIEGKMDSINNVTSPLRWRYWNFGTDIYFAENTGHIPDVFSFKFKIKPGEELNNFSYVTEGLPIISEAYLRGYNYALYQGDENYTKVDDYLNNSVILTTIATSYPPDPFFPLNFLDTLLNYNQRSLELGWITNQATADKYDTLFNSAKTLLEGNHIPWVDSTLHTVLEEVDEDSSGNITSEAYALLRYNTEYLLDNLPDVIPSVLTSLSPSIALPYISNVPVLLATVSVIGEFFTDSSIVYYNGLAKETDYVSDSVITYQLYSSDMESAGSYTVWVSNYGSNSDTLLFSVVETLPDSVIPILECVRANQDGTFTAFFGYDNQNSEAVFIPVLYNNWFSPYPEYRGQPEIFQPGIHNNVFTADFEDKELIWTLTDNSVIASPDSTPCEE